MSSLHVTSIIQFSSEIHDASSYNRNDGRPPLYIDGNRPRAIIGRFLHLHMVLGTQDQCVMSSTCVLLSARYRESDCICLAIKKRLHGSAIMFAIVDVRSKMR